MNEKAYLRLAQATVERKTSETEDFLIRRIDDPPNRASSPLLVRAPGLPSSIRRIRLPAPFGLTRLVFRKTRNWHPGIGPGGVVPPVAADVDRHRLELAALCRLHSTANSTR